MSTSLLSYYEAIEKASADMLDAARASNWTRVLQLEGTCVLLINKLRHAAKNGQLDPVEAAVKSQIMKNILAHDAEIRQLTEPWIKHLDQMLVDNSKTLQ